jgi:tetratricopeptide (TPR) repeat protein
MPLGSFACQTGKLEKALFHNQKCLKIREKEASDPLTVADAHASVAWSLAKNGQSVQALFHFRKSLAIQEKEDPEAPPEVASTILEALGQSEEAQEYYRRANDIS